MNEAVAKLELVGTPRGPDCGYDPDVIMADVDKSAWKDARIAAITEGFTNEIV
jgi:hypothetical protein